MFAFSLPSTLQAQESRIEGVVHAIATGAVIAGAVVKVHAGSSDSTTVTNFSGEFAFARLAGTSGTLEVTANGFQSLSQSWSEQDRLLRLDLVLTPSPLAQQVFVTATRTGTSLGESPLSDVQLTSDDLHATPALTLDDALRQVPGFRLFRRRSSSRVRILLLWVFRCGDSEAAAQAARSSWKTAYL